MNFKKSRSILKKSLRGVLTPNLGYLDSKFGMNRTSRLGMSLSTDRFTDKRFVPLLLQIVIIFLGWKTNTSCEAKINSLKYLSVSNIKKTYLSLCYATHSFGKVSQHIFVPKQSVKEYNRWSVLLCVSFFIDIVCQFNCFHFYSYNW